MCGRCGPGGGGAAASPATGRLQLIKSHPKNDLRALLRSPEGHVEAPHKRLLRKVNNSAGVGETSWKRHPGPGKVRVRPRGHSQERVGGPEPCRLITHHCRNPAWKLGYKCEERIVGQGQTRGPSRGPSFPSLWDAEASLPGGGPALLLGTVGRQGLRPSEPGQCPES